MRLVLKICITIILFSCSSGTDENDGNDTRGFLISWESQFVKGMGQQMEGYYQNREQFIEPYIRKSYSGDTLKVETLHEINSCGETIGVIGFSNDTLVLLTKLVSEKVCTSVEFHKFKYTIAGKGIKNYAIKY